MNLPDEISQELVDKLLSKLINDNEFREVFQREPRIALAYLGHEAATKASPGDEGVWGCAKCQELASPESIRNAYDTLSNNLKASLANKGVLGLDAAKPNTAS